MSAGSCVKKIAAEFNVGLKVYKFTAGFKPSFVGPILDTPKSKDNLHLNHRLTSPLLCKNHTEKLYFVFPKLDVAIRKSIIEPEKSIKINFNLPVRNSTVTELDLPLHIEKEIKEPGKVISKKAIRMIRVRRRKMRRHKRNKYLKKYASELYQRKLKREMAKESNFQSSLNTILSNGKNFSAEEYVNDLLTKVHWKRPVTHVKNRLAPQWVIKQYLKEKEEKEILNIRLRECLK